VRGDSSDTGRYSLSVDTGRVCRVREHHIPIKFSVSGSTSPFAPADKARLSDLGFAKTSGRGYAVELPSASLNMRLHLLHLPIRGIWDARTT
jgi:hypothetical protein